jgi:hypothetical protein
MDASVTKFLSQFKKSQPPMKTAKVREIELKMLKTLQRHAKPLKLEFKCIMMKEACTQMLDDICG